MLAEDDDTTIRVLRDALEKLGVDLTVTHSRDVAIHMATREEFDLVICDLRLPTEDGGLDADAEHGSAVFGRLREIARGAPVVVFSGFGSLDLMKRLLEEGRQEDFCGAGSERPLITFFKKSESIEIIEHIQEISDQLRTLESVEISSGGVELNVSPMEKRALRIFARRSGGAVVKARGLGGGLSGTRALRLRIEDPSGALAANVVAKIGQLDQIEDEYRRYKMSVAPKLPIGNVTSHVDSVRAGSWATGGLFYQLADGYDDSLFDLLRKSPDMSAEVVDKLRRITAPWREGGPAVQSMVGDVRRRLISDETFHPLRRHLPGIDIETLESSILQIRECDQHADLHGLNVLINDDNEAVLIDYGSVKRATASLDPITLELGCLFHPAAKDLADWPDEETLSHWYWVDKHSANCPRSSFVKACRRWAVDVAAGDREIAATAYAYAARQLQYQEKTSLAVSLITHLAEVLSQE